jgi:hypothetical protein
MNKNINGFKIMDEIFKAMIITCAGLISLSLFLGFSATLLPAVLMLFAAVLLADIFWVGVRH